MFVCSLRGHGLLRRWSQAFLDDLVEFAPIQPDAAALGTVVYLYVLSLRHDEVHAADGTRKDGIGCHDQVSFRCFDKLADEARSCSDWRSKRFFVSAFSKP